MVRCRRASGVSHSGRLADGRSASDSAVTLVAGRSVIASCSELNEANIVEPSLGRLSQRRHPRMVVSCDHAYHSPESCNSSFLTKCDETGRNELCVEKKWPVAGSTGL